MSSMSEYLDNPYWAKLYNYGIGAPNDGFMKFWQQGSSGMMSGLPIYSNEYAYMIMKHGRNELPSSRGNVKNFAPSVDRHLQHQVTQCSKATINPAGCQLAAVRDVFSNDNPHPHPYGMSYRTGCKPNMMPVLPTRHPE